MHRDVPRYLIAAFVLMIIRSVLTTVSIYAIPKMMTRMMCVMMAHTMEREGKGSLSPEAL
jgi:hypothetical protein